MLCFSTENMIQTLLRYLPIGYMYYFLDPDNQDNVMINTTFRFLCPVVVVVLLGSQVVLWLGAALYMQYAFGQFVFIGT